MVYILYIYQCRLYCGLGWKVVSGNFLECSVDSESR